MFCNARRSLPVSSFFLNELVSAFHQSRQTLRRIAAYLFTRLSYFVQAQSVCDEQPTLLTTG
jgi:hypothetical protein